MPNFERVSTGAPLVLPQQFSQSSSTAIGINLKQPLCGIDPTVRPFWRAVRNENFLCLATSVPAVAIEVGTVAKIETRYDTLTLRNRRR